MVGAQVTDRQALQSFQVFLILGVIRIARRKGRVFVGNPDGIGGKEDLHFRLVGRYGTGRMAGRFQDREGCRSQVDPVPFGKDGPRNVVPPVHVEPRQRLLRPHVPGHEPAKGIGCFDGLLHLQDIPGPPGGAHLDGRPCPLEIGNDAHMIEVGVKNDDLSYFTGIDSEGLHLLQDVGQDEGDPAVQHHRPVPALQDVDPRFLPAQVPEILRHFSRLSDSHENLPRPYGRSLSPLILRDRPGKDQGEVLVENGLRLWYLMAVSGGLTVFHRS